MISSGASAPVFIFRKFYIFYSDNDNFCFHKEVIMGNKIATAIGYTLVYSACLIGTYEIASFAIERCVELVTSDHKTVFDKAEATINKLKNHGYATVERKEEEE